jgi:hypothetical protein
MESSYSQDLRLLQTDELERYRRVLLREYLRSCLDELEDATGFYRVLGTREALKKVDDELKQRCEKPNGPLC